MAKSGCGCMLHRAARQRERERGVLDEVVIETSMQTCWLYYCWLKVGVATCKWVWLLTWFSLSNLNGCDSERPLVTLWGEEDHLTHHHPSHSSPPTLITTHTHHPSHSSPPTLITTHTRHHPHSSPPTLVTTHTITTGWGLTR